MAKLYEKAWNQVVNNLGDWKKNIIINNFPYDNAADKRVSDEVVHDAIALAERWDRESKGEVTTPAP